MRAGLEERLRAEIAAEYEAKTEADYETLRQHLYEYLGKATRAEAEAALDKDRQELARDREDLGRSDPARSKGRHDQRPAEHLDPAAQPCSSPRGDPGRGPHRDRPGGAVAPAFGGERRSSASTLATECRAPGRPGAKREGAEPAHQLMPGAGPPKRRQGTRTRQDHPRAGLKTALKMADCRLRWDVVAGPHRGTRVARPRHFATRNHVGDLEASARRASTRPPFRSRRSPQTFPGRPWSRGTP